MALGTALAKSLSSFSAARHDEMWPNTHGNVCSRK
jgi:hypothetical protein